MGLGLKRRDPQRLAAAKFDEAERLLVHRRFADSYDLAGYEAKDSMPAQTMMVALNDAQSGIVA